jgi:hypothetical protein
LPYFTVHLHRENQIFRLLFFTIPTFRFRCLRGLIESRIPSPGKGFWKDILLSEEVLSSENTIHLKKWT